VAPVPTKISLALSKVYEQEEPEITEKEPLEETEEEETPPQGGLMARGIADGV